MVEVLTVMTLGMLIGFKIRKKKGLIKSADKFTTWAIYLLLFLLGVSVGTNEKIVSNIHHIGLNSLIITFASVLGSILTAFIIYKSYFKEK